MNAAKIAKELETLEAKNRACAEQLRVLYGRYLTELSHTASQQLMAVCYHLCTQSYPEAFLGLSPQAREQLQKRVRSQGERLRQQLSLEGLLLPDPGDVKEPVQPRVAVIKAELTGDDLEVLTSALNEDNSDRILALLKDKDIELPFDLEAVMEQRRQLATESELPEGELPEGELPSDISGAPSDHPSPQDEADAPAAADGSDGVPKRPKPERPQKPERPNDEGTEDLSQVSGSESLSHDAAPSQLDAPPADAEGYSSTPAHRSDSSAAVSEPGRSLGRRFLEDILSGRALEWRRGSEDSASMSGEGSLRVESRSKHGATAAKNAKNAEGAESAADSQAEERADSKAVAELGDAEASLEAAVQPDESPDLAELDAFADNNGFDPDFEPPPAEDRYEPTPLRSSDKLDISPGVLASALVAEGEDDRVGMMMRPLPYDGSTELSEEALRDPFALIRWVERMERGISQRLRQSSQRMTRSLEQSHILNNELPDGLLEAAVRPDGDHEDDSDRSMPHVLSLRLNAAGKGNRPRKDQSIRIVAIYLRLGEIEFATPGVMAWRNQLRNQVKQLRRLSDQYKDCKHAQSVVEAQELWNNSWEQSN